MLGKGPTNEATLARCYIWGSFNANLQFHFPLKPYSHLSLVPRLLPAFQCCTQKKEAIATWLSICECWSIIWHTVYIIVIHVYMCTILCEPIIASVGGWESDVGVANDTKFIPQTPASLTIKNIPIPKWLHVWDMSGAHALPPLDIIFFPRMWNIRWASSGTRLWCK